MKHGNYTEPCDGIGKRVVDVHVDQTGRIGGVIGRCRTCYRYVKVNQDVTAQSHLGITDGEGI